MLLDARGVECSTGSACSAGVAQPVARAARDGRRAAEARGTLRFSLGHDSTAGRRRRPPLDAHRAGGRAGPQRRADRGRVVTAP